MLKLVVFHTKVEFFQIIFYGLYCLLTNQKLCSIIIHLIVLKEYIFKKEYITKPDADIVLVYQVMSI